MFLEELLVLICETVITQVEGAIQVSERSGTILNMRRWRDCFEWLNWTPKMSGGDDPDLCDEDLTTLEGLIMAVGSLKSIPAKRGRNMKLKATIMMRNIYESEFPTASRRNWWQCFGAFDLRPRIAFQLCFSIAAVICMSPAIQLREIRLAQVNRQLETMKNDLSCLRMVSAKLKTRNVVFGDGSKIRLPLCQYTSLCGRRPRRCCFLVPNRLNRPKKLMNS
jgi:hypothetical protein